MLITSLIWEMNQTKLITLLFMKTIMVIGVFQKLKSQEKWKVLSLNKISSNKLSQIFKILFKVKNGILKWEFLIKEAIYYMALQEQVNLHSLKL